MIWLAYAGLCVVGIGCLILMIALFEYQDIQQDLAENLADSCNRFADDQAEECDREQKIGMEYQLQRQADNYRTLTLGSIGIGSGLALFVASYTRPSWFRRISTEPLK